MTTYGELRKEIYDYHKRRYPYIFEKWRWYSYRKFKANLYMNVSPLLTYLFIKTGVHPNAVTTTYALLGILGGILIAIPVKWFIIAGIILFYFRPFLDWSDGLLARVTQRISITGDILDYYGAQTGWVALWAGLGLYLANKSGNVIFFYLAPIIPSLLGLNLISSAKSRLYENHMLLKLESYIAGTKNRSTSLSNSNVAAKYPLVSRIFNFFQTLFEHNAGFVDLVCLIVLLESFLPFFISWIIFLAFLVWQILFFAAVFFMIARGGWAEKELQSKIEQIDRKESAT